jgi:hypothetical protein
MFRFEKLFKFSKIINFQTKPTVKWASPLIQTRGYALCGVGTSCRYKRGKGPPRNKRPIGARANPTACFLGLAQVSHLLSFDYFFHFSFLILFNYLYVI